MSTQRAMNPVQVFPPTVLSANGLPAALHRQKIRTSEAKPQEFDTASWGKEARGQ